MSHYHLHDWEYWSALGHRKPIKRRTGALNRVFRPPEPELGIALQWPGLYGRGASMGVIEDSRVKLPVGASRGYKYRAVWNERAITLSTSASPQNENFLHLGIRFRPRHFVDSSGKCSATRRLNMFL